MIMKATKTLQLIFLIFLVFSVFTCGNSKRVITDDGKVYNVDGNTIKRNGKEVTDKLNRSEIEKIEQLLKEKEDLQEAEEKK